MKIQRVEDVPACSVEQDGAEGVQIRLLITEADGAPNFCMRQFTLASGGHTPRHVHPWEHEVYVLSGSGVVFGAEGDRPIQPGDCIYVPPGEEHQFRNEGRQELKFLCLVPKDQR